MKRYTLHITLLLMMFYSLTFFGQGAPFSMKIEPMSIAGLGGIQSYAFGQHDGKWLIIGGRLDGLHQRQPFASFDASGNNNQIIVIDPIAQQKWSASINTLPTNIKEQLSSTNMEFYQSGQYLYVIGGYGYSATAGDHITYSGLVAIDVPATINAIITSNSFTSFFRQINDSKFTVTGGRLEKINNTYYLIGGQKFIGRYNPMGPTHGPGFFQEYTNAIRKFIINDDGTSITINHLPSFIDTVTLHRRDYNATPQILPSGEEGITAFSGVFQYDIDLPYLSAVNIDSTNYVLNTSFTQYYNHYHCANVPIYDATNNQMHTVFFGGIAQYYDSMGVLVQNNNVPFVKTIARVTRDASGLMTEYKLPIQMPEYLGAGAEYIPIESLARYKNGVLKLDSILNDTTLIGYIYGGINSSAPNIFFINTGTQSSSSSQIFKVYLIKNTEVGIDQVNTQSTNSLKLQVYPNPNRGVLYLQFNLDEIDTVKLKMYDLTGRLIDSELLDGLKTGTNYFEKPIRNLENGLEFILILETSSTKSIQKIIIEP
jgi:hypothetical protein